MPQTHQLVVKPVQATLYFCSYRMCLFCSVHGICLMCENTEVIQPSCLQLFPCVTLLMCHDVPCNLTYIRHYTCTGVFSEPLPGPWGSPARRVPPPLSVPLLQDRPAAAAWLQCFKRTATHAVL